MNEPIKRDFAQHIGDLRIVGQIIRFQTYDGQHWSIMAIPNIHPQRLNLHTGRIDVIRG